MKYSQMIQTNFFRHSDSTKRDNTISIVHSSLTSFTISDQVVYRYFGLRPRKTSSLPQFAVYISPFHVVTSSFGLHMAKCLLYYYSCSKQSGIWVLTDMSIEM